MRACSGLSLSVVNAGMCRPPISSIVQHDGLAQPERLVQQVELIVRDIAFVELRSRWSEDTSPSNRCCAITALLAEGELSVGMGNAMPGLSGIAAFVKAYPQVSLQVSTGSHDKIMRQDITHTIDVGTLPEVLKNSRFRRKT